MKKMILVCLTVIFLVTPAFAYRPFYTEDAEIVGDKVFQNEFSVDQAVWKSKDTDTVITDIMYYGVTKNIHIAFGVPYVTHKINEGDTTKGISDMFAVFKYVAVRDSKDVARVAVKFQGKWNNGDYDKYLGWGDKEYAGSLCFTQPAGEKLLIHAQGGYTIVTDAKNPVYENYWFYGIGADLTVTKSGHFMAELLANKNIDPTLQQQRFINAGAYYVISDNWNVDATYRYGLTDTAQDHGFGVGIVFHY